MCNMYIVHLLNWGNLMNMTCRIQAVKMRVTFVKVTVGTNSISVTHTKKKKKKKNRTDLERPCRVCFIVMDV